MRPWLLLLLCLPLSARAADPAMAGGDWLRADEGERAAPTRLERVVPWRGGDRVRIARTLEGLPVEGYDRVVALDLAGRGVRATGPALDLRPVTGARRLDATTAQGAATRVVRLLGDGQLWPARAQAVVFVAGDGTARHAWRVDASTASPPATWRLVVDAETGEVLHTAPTSFTVDGNVYPGSPATSEVTRLALPGLVEAEALEGEHAEVFSCDVWEIDDSLFGTNACHDASRHAVPDGDGNYLFAPDPGSVEDPFAEVQVYYHLDQVSQWFLDEHAFAHDRPMRGIVNFPMTNAFFGDFDGDGQGDVSFGHSEDGVDFAYDGDVVYHEFGHSVIAAVSGLGFLQADELGMDWSGGALNEGTADAFTLLITGDPVVGEYAGSAEGLGGAIRDVGEPLRCPDALEGESHADGEIWGSLVWAMIDDPRIGRDATSDLVYGAIATWTTRTGWPEAGASLVDAAADLRAAGLLDAEGEAAVAEHVDTANLLDCERILVLDGGTHSTLLVNLGMGGDFEEVPGEVQYAVEVPEDAWGLRFEITDFRRSDDELGWNLYVRRGEPVGHEVVSLDLFGVALARPVDFDEHHAGAEPAAIEWTLESDPPLEPGATYYFSLSSDNLGDLEVLRPVWARVEVTATTFDPEPRGGCACTTTPPSATPLWPLLLLLLWGSERERSPRSTRRRADPRRGRNVNVHLEVE